MVPHEDNSGLVPWVEVGLEGAVIRGLDNPGVEGVHQVLTDGRKLALIVLAGLGTLAT